MYYIILHQKKKPEPAWPKSSNVKAFLIKIHKIAHLDCFEIKILVSFIFISQKVFKQAYVLCISISHRQKPDSFLLCEYW